MRTWYDTQTGRKDMLNLDSAYCMHQVSNTGNNAAKQALCTEHALTVAVNLL